MQEQRTATPTTMREVTAALANAWRLLTEGHPANVTMMPFLLALVAMETGSGKKIYNWNLGNQTTAEEADAYYQHASLPHRFLSYPDLRLGAQGFLKFIIMRPRYGELLSAMIRGDAGEVWERYQRDWVVADLSAEHRRNFLNLARSFGADVPQAATKAGGNGGAGPLIAMVLGLGVAAGLAWLVLERQT